MQYSDDWEAAKFTNSLKGHKIFKGHKTIDVISAVYLDNEQLGKIKEEVDAKTGLDVTVKNIVDENIIGGLVLKIGESIIDLSVKNRIEDLKSKLKALEVRGEGFGVED